MADTSFGGLADSLAQAFMFDKPLLEARRVRQLARVTATGAREQARLAKDAARQRANSRLCRSARIRSNLPIPGMIIPSASAIGGRDNC